MRRRPAAAAFFDFDRTVVDGDAGVLFARELVRLRRHRLRADGRGTLAWAARNLAYEAQVARVLGKGLALQVGTQLRVVKRSRLLRTVYEGLDGLPLEEVRGLARDFADDVLAGLVFPDARREMRRHKDEGRRIIIVSTGMHLLIEPLRRHLPVDDVIAVHLLASRGVLTGKVDGPLWGRDKARAVRTHAQGRGFDLAASWAYSDHFSDLALLRLVGHPVAVNPDLRLAYHARRKAWPIAYWKRARAAP